MALDEWADILPLLQSAINNVPSRQRSNVAPVTAFHGFQPTPPINTFYRSAKSNAVTITELQAERALKVTELVQRAAGPHPVVQGPLQNRRAHERENASRGRLSNFDVGDYVLIASADFHAGDKLELRWRGPRRVVKAVSDYIYTCEDLPNGVHEDVHISRLKFYHDAELDSEEVMSHVLASERGMTVARLMGLGDTPNGVQDRVRWLGLPTGEDTLERIGRVHQDVPQLFSRLICRNNTPKHLADWARREVGPLEGRV